jgi:hypothetical protein
MTFIVATCRGGGPDAIAPDVPHEIGFAMGTQDLSIDGQPPRGG